MSAPARGFHSSALPFLASRSIALTLMPSCARVISILFKHCYPVKDSWVRVLFIRKVPFENTEITQWHAEERLRCALCFAWVVGEIAFFLPLQAGPGNNRSNSRIDRKLSHFSFDVQDGQSQMQRHRVR